jgi:hypothetical protein
MPVYTSFGAWPRDHYKAFQWFPLTCSIPTEVSPKVLVQITKGPTCAVWFSSESILLPTHSQPDGSQVPRSTLTVGWYAKTRFYHILRQAVLIYAHDCTVFMADLSMNWSLDFDMMTNHGLSGIHWA